MFVDEDESSSNYPLAAFVFDPNDLQSPAQPAYLCRFDPVHLECFSTPLFTRGLNSAIPFVGKIVGSTYFYANGLGVDDRDPATNVRKTRPLFLVRDVNENEPDFDSNEYYINRVDNFAMRCADLTAFDKLGCFNDNGEQSECVSFSQEFFANIVARTRCLVYACARR